MFIINKYKINNGVCFTKNGELPYILHMTEPYELKNKVQIKLAEPGIRVALS